MPLAYQKRIAAQILKCGVTRIRIHSAKDVEEALTRNDIRDLIKSGKIIKIQKKGTTKAYSKIGRIQKKRGRRKYDGSKKGSVGARTYHKGIWIIRVRAMRRLLNDMKENKQLESGDYRNLYRKVRGGFFRDRKHILNYIKENNMLKGRRLARLKATKKPPARKQAKIIKKIAPKKEVKGVKK